MSEAVSAPRRARKPSGMGGVYRLCRMLHAYLSAFAFLTLIFFSVTGLLLDHPDWLAGKPREQERRLTLSLATLQAATAAREPSRVLAAAVARLTPVVGAYRSGDVEDGQADLRFEGVKGSTTALIDLKTGEADVTLDRAGLLAVLGDLHRGKNASLPWRAVIDVSAVLVTLLSAIGYVLFFSLRFRLKTSLVLTGVSLGLLVLVAWLFTP